MPTDDRAPHLPRLSSALHRTAADDLVDDTDEPEWTELDVHGDLSAWEARRLVVDGCRLTNVVLTGARLERVQLTDVVLDSCELSGAWLEAASLQRVELRQCRMVGALLGGARLRNVRVVGCKLDRSVLTAVVGERIHVSGSLLVECDLRDAKLPSARFADCDLSGADVGGADLRGARLHGSRLDHLCGVAGLAGAEVDDTQLLALAPLLAAAAGIVVGSQAPDQDGSVAGPWVR